MVTYCYNLEGGFSIWTDIAYSRIWRVGDKYYGVTSNGIYELTGNTDAGVAYTSTIRTTKNNLGTMQLKRLQNVYLDTAKTGTAICTSEDETSSSAEEFTNAARIKFGKGLKGRFLSLTLQSKVEDFEVGLIEFRPEVLSRSVK